MKDFTLGGNNDCEAPTTKDYNYKASALLLAVGLGTIINTLILLFITSIHV